MPGADACATSKQYTLTTALEFARETRRLRINAVALGLTPKASLTRNAKMFMLFMLQHVTYLLVPHIKYWSKPQQAARVITKVSMTVQGAAGFYCDDKSNPILSSELTAFNLKMVHYPMRAHPSRGKHFESRYGRTDKTADGLLR